MSTQSKLYYLNYVPLNAEFPLRMTLKTALGQNKDMIETISDYSQVIYYSEKQQPIIKSEKGKILAKSLLPDYIPEKWAAKLPPVLGFHMHETLEINLIVEGELIYFIDHRSVELKAGDVIFFNSYIPHGWYVELSDNVKILELSFKADLLKNKIFNDSQIVRNISGINLKHFTLRDYHAKKMEMLMKNMYEEINRMDYGYKFNVLLNLYQLIIEIIRSSKIASETPCRNTNKIVASAQEYIIEHLSDHPTLNDIANAVYVTPHYLSFVFKKVMGIGIADYINRQKIQTAAALLADKELSVLSVAMQSGFTSKANFYRVFKEYYGITPQQMREASN